MKVLDKIALGALAVIIITNPASSQVVLDILEVTFKQIFMYGSPINLVASGVLTAYLAYKIWDGRERTNIPKKNTKTLKAGKLIKT